MQAITSKNKKPHSRRLWVRPPPGADKPLVSKGLFFNGSKAVTRLLSVFAGVALGFALAVPMACAWVDASIRGVPGLAVQLLTVAFLSGGVTGGLFAWGRFGGKNGGRV